MKAVIVLLLIAACDLGQHVVPDGGNPTALGPSDGCSGACHGAASSIAPPRDTQGHSNLTAIGVGAHQAHLQGSDWHKRFTCDACHTVPAEVGSPGHILVAGANGQLTKDPLPAEVIFTGLGSGASWDHDSATCTNSYCHGDGPALAMGGGTNTKPVWTLVDGSQSKCGSCHGNPPPPPHTQETDCGLCHQSMNPGDFAAGKISYPELHIDGKVEVVSTGACDSCHGSNGQSAPPKDTQGNTSTMSRGVGTHAAHMTANSSWHATIQCNECHTVPGSTSDQTHLDGVTEVVFNGSLGIPGAAYDPATQKCTNTFCHGGGNSLLSGGTKISPVFTAANLITSMGNVDCQACHGMPPTSLPNNGGTHPQDTNCGKCHPTMTPGQNTTITYPQLHMNGTVEVINDQPCNDCHGDRTATPIVGDAAINAPPTDTTGGTSTTLRSVGAHQSHMMASTWRAPIACGECHLVPANLLAKGHVDSALPAEVIFGNLAGATASWNGSSCSNTYCHGATLSDGGAPAGGTATKPVWTVVDGSQSQCGSCHGLPPPPPHPVDSDCGKCHPTMTAGMPGVITDPSKHIDGNLDVLGDQPCNSCHGSTTSNAPPKDTQGNTATTARGVGAHMSHLAPGNQFFKAVLCQDCHRVPATVNSQGHIDTPLPAEVIFSTRAGSSPTWNGAQCSNTYCHGSTLTDGGGGAGGTATSPLWAKVDGSQAQCTSCHGNPPPLPHPQNSDCGQCHADVMAGSPTTFTDATKHIDGNLDVTGGAACNSCHGDHTSTPASNADKVNAPPFDSTGAGTATTLRGVGAHQAHLGGSTFGHVAVTCGECHLVPASVNSAGHIDTPLPAEMTFTGIAAGSTWNGSNCSTYCHGSTLSGGGGTATAPQWTKVDGTQAQCTSCHGNPPPAPHTTDTNCNGCHPDITTGKHIDGTVDVTAGSNHPPGYGMVTMHGYDADKTGFSTCATANCHGTSLQGGSTGGPSCATATGCHDKVGTGYTWQTQCTFCHGDINTPSGNGAPPQGVLGATAATDPTVGAHAKHVGATSMHAAWDCTMCHTKPTSALTPGHIDGTGAQVQAELHFSTLNPASTYSFTATTCAASYCHGTGRTNGTSPAWTSQTALTCTSCHNAPAPGQPATGMSGEHDKHIRDERMKCSQCHSSVVNTTPAITNPALHVDGVKEIQFSGGGTYNASAKSCSGLGNGCHGTKTW